VKRIFSLCVVSIAAIGVTAGLATASASATVLCKTAPVGNVCPTSAVYPVGTEIKSSITNPAVFSYEGSTIQTCSGSVLNTTITSAGGEGLPVVTSNSAYSFSGCTRSFINELLGTSEINWTTGNNGKFQRRSNNSFNWNSVFGTCHEEVAGAAELVSSSSQIVFNHAGVIRNAGSCWPIVFLDAAYKISSPSPIYVASH
jgi:hypothetical protein